MPVPPHALSSHRLSQPAYHLSRALAPLPVLPHDSFGSLHEVNNVLIHLYLDTRFMERITARLSKMLDHDARDATNHWRRHDRNRRASRHDVSLSPRMARGSFFRAPERRDTGRGEANETSCRMRRVSGGKAKALSWMTEPSLFLWLVIGHWSLVIGHWSLVIGVAGAGARSQSWSNEMMSHH